MSKKTIIFHNMDYPIAVQRVDEEVAQTFVPLHQATYCPKWVSKDIEGEKYDGERIVGNKRLEKQLVRLGIINAEDVW